MCILVRRKYEVCGHTVEKVIRCSLPFYWYDGRMPPLPEGSTSPLFHCYNCIDEKEQFYRVGCPECTGRGDVHGARDLIRETRIVDGRSKDPFAYERVLRNYHGYLVTYIYWVTAHTTLMYTLAPIVLQHARESGIAMRVAWDSVMEEGGMDLWVQNPIVADCFDKLFAEQKCRQDKDHILPDSIGAWLSKENHLSEHRPYLNNVSTAIKRSLADVLIGDFEQVLHCRFWPMLCEGDTLDEQLENFEAQPLFQQIDEYWRRRGLVENSDPPLRGPPRGPGRQLPWETLEYVPPQQARGGTVLDRYDGLKGRLDYLISQCEAQIPMDDERILEERTPERQETNNRFNKRTLYLIYEILAADPGLSDSRMNDIARYFDSIFLGPWFKELGNPLLRQEPEEYPADWDEDNDSFSGILRRLDDTAQQHNLGVDSFWEKVAYRKVLVDPGNRNAQPEEVMQVALNRWRDFYSSYMHIVSSVMVSHVRLRQEDLDAEMLSGRLSDVCGICLETWNVDGPSNYPARIPCGNGHILCLACFTRHSLEPDPPWTHLGADDGEKKCPLCRGIIQYAEPMPHLEAAVNLLPDEQVHVMHGAVFGE